MIKKLKGKKRFGGFLFGYVKSVENFLDEDDEKTYEAFYCGLCRTMAKKFGRLSSLTLNYEATFLALFHASLSYDIHEDKERKPCTANPFRKVICANEEISLDFAADASVLMTYNKIHDSISDERGLKKLGAQLMHPLAEGANNKITNIPMETQEYISLQMDKQMALERENCAEADEACEPTSNMLGEICRLIPHSEKDSVNIYKFGFFLGRWVYLMDACDDYEKDCKQNSYNFLRYIDNPPQNKEELEKHMRPLLTATLAALSLHYSRLPIKRFYKNLNNIIYLGLAAVQNLVLTGASGEKETAKE